MYVYADISLIYYKISLKYLLKHPGSKSDFYMRV
jgi:hypothetical protein